jgi:hypothetical protein
LSPPVDRDVQTIKIENYEAVASRSLRNGQIGQAEAAERTREINAAYRLVTASPNKIAQTGGRGRPRKKKATRSR